VAPLVLDEPTEAFWKERRALAVERALEGSDAYTRRVRDRAFSPAVSGDGNWVAYEEVRSAKNPCERRLVLLSLATDEKTYLFPKNARLAVPCPVTTQVSLSRDASVVAFCTDAPLSRLDQNGLDDVYVWYRARKQLALVSLGVNGRAGDGSSCNSKISDDGRVVAFESVARDLVPKDPNDMGDVFARDLAGHKTELVSLSDERQPANLPSEIQDISADGNVVAFASAASNLVYADENGAFDVFVRDRVRAHTERVSVASIGTEVQAPSHVASLSADGRFVSFVSDGKNLVPRVDGGPIYVRDRVRGRTEAYGSAIRPGDTRGEPQLSGDGLLLSYISVRPDRESAMLVLVDRETKEHALIGETGTELGRAPRQRMSRDGEVHAFELLTHLVIAEPKPAPTESEPSDPPEKSP
jgi:Tol biopolymer transport system component